MLFWTFFLFQGTLEYLTGAAISKLIAAVATYPYQVVRARLQDQQSNYSGALNCVRQTFRYEGMSGLYKGLVPYLVHVMPNICIVFLIYENMSKWQANVSFHTAAYCQQRILLDLIFFWFGVFCPLHFINQMTNWPKLMFMDFFGLQLVIMDCFCLQCE